MIRKIRTIRIRYPYTNHTPLTHRTSNPLWTVCPMICPALSKYPDEFILNTKVVRNVSTSTVTPSTRLSDVDDTYGMVPSPLRTSCPVITLEPVFHPRMNSRSEQNTLHCVRAPLTLSLSCLVFVFLLLPCISCFSPLYSPIDPVAAVDYIVAEYDYYVNDHTSTVELPGKQSHSLPHISPILSVLFLH